MVVRQESLPRWKRECETAAYDCFFHVRIEELFHIIADYPDSHPAVEELRFVLATSSSGLESQTSSNASMHAHLARHLKNSLQRRLLHPGASTMQIIDVYINTIKVLREIDPSDRLLEAVAKSVRSYLRHRKDTVRCIITSLTDEEAGGDLYHELKRQDARPLEHAQLDSDDEEECPDMNWQPPPKQRFGSRGGSRGSDILSMLVSIYGSKDLFVSEYRLMLADKLLNNLEYDTDKEVHTLELLKLRFGEQSMRQCEIMIKDIDDSKRIISNIHTTMQTEHNVQPPVDAAIVSHIFWPALQKEDIKHHERIQSELDKFGAEYGKLKNPRRLLWLGQLGTVQLDLEVVEEGPQGPAMETREFNCSPLLATLILYFEDRDEWTASDLSNETGIQEHLVVKRMTYWVNQHVVRQHRGDFGASTRYVLATLDHWNERNVLNISSDEGPEGQVVSLGAQEEEEMEIYESYIVGMLTNLGQLPLERIHNMLKTFVTGSDHKYGKTPQQLSSFLQNLCKQDKLECGPDGMYKLVKK